MPSATTALIFTSILFVIGMFIMFVVITDLSDMIEDQEAVLKPIENIEKQTLTGQITELSIFETYCIVLFKNDLTEYKVYGLSQGQYELLDLAKTNQEQVTIDYELDEETRIIKDVKVGVVEPEPESEPVEFNWWLVLLPAGIVILFFVGRPILSWGIDYIGNKEQRKIEAEKTKKEKEEKYRIKKVKKVEAERQAYKTEGRSSRTAKAAQMLDEQEGKKRRKN